MESIIESFLFLDKKILEIINITLSNNLFDNVMPMIDKREGFILPVLFFWIFSIFRNPTKRKKLIILINRHKILITFSLSFIQLFGLLMCNSLKATTNAPIIMIVAPK